MLTDAITTVEVVAAIREAIGATEGVDAVLDLRTIHVGPDDLVVAAGGWVDPARSALLYRMTTGGRGHMPYLGGRLVDDLLQLARGDAGKPFRADTHGSGDATPWAPVQFTSALKGEGIHDLLELAAHDIVVSSTASPLPIIGKGLTESALKARGFSSRSRISF